ncbi:MAG TPA: hypothetical protein VL475_13220 [Planctomycetaceae bacterium]|jgi:hypothetical protein|nr:hypothetical protein [Planctomycetaceae bacterium]
MPDHDAAMLAFVKLAGISQDRRQLGPRDKFLVLAAAAACRGGWLAVAERCRELVLAHNAVHLLHRFPSFVEACKAPAFEPYLRQTERFCSYEKAEYLLAQQAITPDLPRITARLSPGDYALLLLGRSEKRRGP